MGVENPEKLMWGLPIQVGVDILVWGLKLLPYPGHMYHILAVIGLSEIEILKKSPAAPTSCQ